MFQKRLLCVTGLPRSGSTLLCQLLSHHPDLYCTGHSSPLCSTLIKIRQQLSDSEFLRSQMDVDFPKVYQRLINAFTGFVDGWFAETDKQWVVDKNRAWLHHIETLHHLDSNVRMLVCVRELGQIYGSIEAQHQKTLLLDFPNDLADFSRYDRADNLFARQGVVGSPLTAIENLQDLDTALQDRLFYVVFEHLLQDPITVMQSIYQWLGLPAAEFDPQALVVRPHESDSYYCFKYRHQTYSSLRSPSVHPVPQRIQRQLQQQFTWFYHTFYPGLVSQSPG